MFDDIVKRLRTAPPSMLGVRLEAADLLEAQQAEIERLRAERDAERALADQLATELAECWSIAYEYAHVWLTAVSGQTPPPSLAAYNEARRG